MQLRKSGEWGSCAWGILSLPLSVLLQIKAFLNTQFANSMLLPSWKMDRTIISWDSKLWKYSWENFDQIQWVAPIRAVSLASTRGLINCVSHIQTVRARWFSQPLQLKLRWIRGWSWNVESTYRGIYFMRGTPAQIMSGSPRRSSYISAEDLGALPAICTCGEY